MIVPILGRLDAINRMNNSAYSWMNSANAMMGLCSSAGNLDMQTAFTAGKRLELAMLQDSFNYKIAEAQEASLKKLSDENIKRSFSTFA